MYIVDGAFDLLYYSGNNVFDNSMKYHICALDVFMGLYVCRDGWHVQQKNFAKYPFALCSTGCYGVCIGAVIHILSQFMWYPLVGSTSKFWMPLKWSILFAYGNRIRDCVIIPTSPGRCNCTDDDFDEQKTIRILRFSSSVKTNAFALTLWIHPIW